MIVGFYPAATRERGLLSGVRYWAARLLPAGMLSAIVLAAIADTPAVARNKPPACVFTNSCVSTTDVGPVPIDGVLINGQPANQCGQQGWCLGNRLVLDSLRARAIGWPGGQEPPPDQRSPGDVPHGELSLVTPASDTGGVANDLITQIDATTREQGGFTFGRGNAFEPGGGAPDTVVTGHPNSCQSGQGNTLSCPAVISTDDYEVEYGTGQSDYRLPGLLSLNVIFNYGAPISACAPIVGGAARVADACTPPSHTRITQAQIKRNTAFFRFTAQHTTHFQCQLFRNQRLMFNRGCRSPKPYANPLPRGQYLFTVTGVSRAGVDSKSATKKFTVK